jgi:hypothetical protein
LVTWSGSYSSGFPETEHRDCASGKSRRVGAVKP